MLGHFRIDLQLTTVTERLLFYNQDDCKQYLVVVLPSARCVPILRSVVPSSFAHADECRQ